MLKSSHHQQLLAHSHNSNSSFGVVNGSSNLNNAHHYNNLNEKCTYCLNALASVAIRCAECPNFTLCLKVMFYFILVFLFLILNLIT